MNGFRHGRRVSGYLCFLALAAFAGFGILYGEQVRRADELEAELVTYRLYVQNEAESAARDLGGALNELESNLRKLSAAASPAQHVRLLSEVRRLSDVAGGALGRLSVSHADGYELKQFLTRTGDYANTLMDSVQNGVLLTADDAAQLSAIGTQCSALRGAIGDRMDSGLLPSGAVSTEGFYTAAQNPESVPAYPSLLYDGPFSESSENAPPKGLPTETVSEEQAKGIAARAFPGVDWQYDGKCEAAIVTFDFSGGAGESLSITERGGRVLYWMTEPSGSGSDPLTEAEQKAADTAAQTYLKMAGFDAMHPSYAESYAGVIVLNYAATQDGVVLYPDLVKAYVDRATGKVIGYDARSYYTHHAPRDIGPFALTREDATNAISLSMRVTSVTPCVIPKCETREVLCYECRGTVGDATYLVYINAETGAEEEIFEVIRTETGELVQ